MALWKPFRGTSAALADVPKTDGHAYFCTDDGSLFFDYKDENNELHRKQITAKELTLANLLAESITISEWAEMEYQFAYPSFKLEAGKTYKLTGTHGIDNTSFEVTTQAYDVGADGGEMAALAGCICAEFDIGTFDELGWALHCMLQDNVIIDEELGEPVVGADNVYVIMSISDTSHANTENTPFTINNIVEVQPEYATKSSVDELEERITVLEKSDEPVNLLNESITIETVVDEEIHEIQPIGLVAGKSYILSGTYGASNTAFEFTDTASSDEEVVMFANNSGAINGILMIGIMETPEGSFMMLGAQNPDDIDKVGEFSPVIISSITEVQPEYATQESVDNLSTEITSIDERVTSLENADEPVNLLSEPVIFETAGHEEMHQGNSMLGLVADKTYKVSALVGASATPFEYEVVAVKTDEAGGSVTQIATPDDALFNSHLAIWVMDAIGEVNGEPVNTNIIMIGGSGEGANPEYGSGYNDEFFANDTYSPVVINSIAEIQPEYATKKSVEELSASVSNLESRVSELENPSDNLFKTTYKFAEPWNRENNNNMFLVDRIGLTPGKTYKVTGYYGGESLDTSDGATRFEWTAVATDAKEIGVDDCALLECREDISENGTLSIGVYDGCYIDTSNGALIIDNSKSMLSFGYSGGDSDRPYAKNFVVESLTEVQVDYSTKEEFDELKARVEVLESADEAVNLLSEPITIEAWTSQEMPYEGASLGVAVDKTYTISGTMGSDNSPWSFTTTAMSSESFGLEPGAALLAQEDSINHVAVAIYDRFSLATGVPVFDNSKSYIVSGCSDASDANQPFVIDSVIEAQVEYSTKEEVNELTERVQTIESQLSGNILSEAIVIEAGNTEMEGAPAYMGAIDSIGLEDGKKYQIVYEYNGSTITEDVVATTEFASSFFGIDGIITLSPIDESVENRQFAFLINNDTPVILADKLYADTMTYDASKFSIMAMTMGGTLQVPFNITSIIKAAEEEYATKEEIEDLDTRITALENSTKEQDNLLIESVSLPAATPISYANISRAGLPKLEIGKNYKISYVYNGVASSVEYTCADGVRVGDHLKGCPLMGGATVDTVIYLEDDVFLIIMDSARLDPTNNPAWTLDETSMVIAASGSSEEVVTKELIVESIVEMPLATFTNDTEYNSDLGGYIVNRNVPVSIGDEYVDGMKVKIDYTIDEDKRSIETYIYGVEDGYPIIAASPAGTMADMQHLVYGTKDNGLLIASYLTMNSNGSAGSAFLLITTGTYANPATIPAVKILSIEKADECATKSYVDNLIAEINDKLEALLNGTEA